MSTARPHGVFQNGFDLVDDGGGVCAVFHGSVWSERGTIAVGVQVWDFAKQGGGLFALTAGGREVAAARRQGVFSHTWDLVYDGRAAVLAKKGFWLPGYVLSDVAGAGIGSVTLQNAFGRTLDVHLPDTMPPQTRAFVAAVGLTLLNRARRSSAAAGT